MTKIAKGQLNALGAVFSISTLLLLPPVSVAMNPEVSSNEVYLNIILTCCGWLPGAMHAVYLTLVSETRKLNKSFFTAEEITTDDKGNCIRSYKYATYDENDEKWVRLRALVSDRPLSKLPTAFDTVGAQVFFSDMARLSVSRKFSKNEIFDDFDISTETEPDLEDSLPSRSNQKSVDITKKDIQGIV